MIVRTIEGSKRLRLRTPFPMNGKEPPTQSLRPSGKYQMLLMSEKIAPAKGLSHSGKTTLLSGMQPAEEFSTLVHEIAHLCAAELYVAFAWGNTKDASLHSTKRHTTDSWIRTRKSGCASRQIQMQQFELEIAGSADESSVAH